MRSNASDRYYLKPDGLERLMGWIGQRTNKNGDPDLAVIAEEANVDKTALWRATKGEPVSVVFPALVGLAKRYGAQEWEAAEAMFELRPVEEAEAVA